MGLGACCVKVCLQEAGGGTGARLRSCVVLRQARLSEALLSPVPQVVQSGGKNIELAVMRRDQPLKVKAKSCCVRGGVFPGMAEAGAGFPQTGGKRALPR